jgi:hypothetical protein
LRKLKIYVRPDTLLAMSKFIISGLKSYDSAVISNTPKDLAQDPNPPESTASMKVTLRMWKTLLIFEDLTCCD